MPIRRREQKCQTDTFIQTLLHGFYASKVDQLKKLRPTRSKYRCGRRAQIDLAFSTVRTGICRPTFAVGVCLPIGPETHDLGLISVFAICPL